jgi:hypothetical protein
MSVENWGLESGRELVMSVGCGESEAFRVDPTAGESCGAIQASGFTPRQACFLVLVLEHSGVCLPRHYRAFAGIAHGMTPAVLLVLNFSPFVLYAFSWALYRRERSALSRGRQIVYSCALAGVAGAITVMVTVVGHGLMVAHGLLPWVDVLRIWRYPFVGAFALSLLSCVLALVGRGWSRVLLAACAGIAALVGYEFGLAMSP